MLQSTKFSLKLFPMLCHFFYLKRRFVNKLPIIWHEKKKFVEGKELKKTLAESVRRIKKWSRAKRFTDRWTGSFVISAIRGAADCAPGDRQFEGVRRAVSGRATAVGSAEFRAFWRVEPQRGEAASRRGRRRVAEGYRGQERTLGRREVETAEKRQPGRTGEFSLQSRTSH